MNYTIQNQRTGLNVAEYTADTPKLPYDIDPAYVGEDFVTLDDNGNLIESAAIDPTKWRIDVGAFFDRFGAAKLAILSSDDLVVQAIVKDASVRKYIDLYNRRADLEQALNLLVAKGFPINPLAILDTEPTADEIWSK
jgi:hypothetical protein